MTTAVNIKNPPAAVDADDCELRHPLRVNISPILKSVAGKLSDADIDQWMADLYQANEERGFNLELTNKGELVISPMVNRGGAKAEMAFSAGLFVWNESNDIGGEVYGPNANMRFPDGSRIRPDALWLSPAQAAAMPPVSAGGAITVCPAFVAEIMSETDTLPPLQRKMEQYIANGALLGWLIDPYRRQVHIYCPGVSVQVLDDPETVSGDAVLPGFVFAVRQRIFDLQ